VRFALASQRFCKASVDSHGAQLGSPRASDRQHTSALMAAGVTNIIRDTYASSLERSAKALEALGEVPGYTGSD
jgi:hypothetical protein